LYGIINAIPLLSIFSAYMIGNYKIKNYSYFMGIMQDSILFLGINIFYKLSGRFHMCFEPGLYGKYNAN
jgi:hypothetical protein